MKNTNSIYNMNRFSDCYRKLTAVMAFLVLISGVLHAASELNGVVLDARTKQPIAAARITLVGQKTSAVSDDKGQFKLSLHSTSDVLQVEAYDYNPSEVPVQGKQQVVVHLYPEVFSTYFRNLEGLTGSTSNSALVSSTKGFDNKGQNLALTADELLQTMLGGDVRAISRSSTTGVGASLFVRGVQSLNMNAQPLIVVDGVIWEPLYDATSIHSGFFPNTLDNIDVNDIESISLVKDGASLYGSKAANGVLLIKTKHSHTTVTKIGVNIKAGVTSTPGTRPMMDGENYRIYANELFASAGLSSDALSDLGFLDANASHPIYSTYHNHTDWNKEVYQEGKTSSYSIDVAGGDENAAYFFSLGYTDNDGIVKTTDFQRMNTRFNADLILNSYFKMGVNIGYTSTDRTMQDDGANFYTSPTWLAKIKSPFMSPYTFTSLGHITTKYDDADCFGVGNPTAVLENSLNSMSRFRFNIGIRPQFQLTKELTLSSQYDYNLMKSSERHFIPMGGTAIREMEGYGLSQNEISSQVLRNTGHFDDTRLVYEKQEADYHLKTMYGFRFLYNYLETDYVEEHNTGSDNNTTITGDYDYLQVDGINNETKSMSNYLQAEYDFQKKYFLTAAVSMDASSRFGNETKGGLSLMGVDWGVFPSVNAAWLVSSEPFMSLLKDVNFCKVRAGLGVTGNDALPDYDVLAYFSNTPFMARAMGLVLTNLANTELQWETTARANVGIDLALMDERCNLSFDYFSGQTSNLLVMKDAPIASGMDSYWSNGGAMTNKGFEIAVGMKALNRKNLKWEVGANVGHYRNKITELAEGEFTTSVMDGEILSRVGESAGTFWGYRTAGVFSTEAEAASAYTNPTTNVSSSLKQRNDDGTTSVFQAGDMHFVDQEADGYIDEKDKVVLGNSQPDFYGTISSNLTIGKLTFGTLFTYSVGNDIYNYTRCLLESGKDFSNQNTRMLGRWTGEGQITNQPKAVYGDPMGNARFSDRWIEDGSYLRLKTLSLSYKVPIKSTFIEGFQVWASVNNLATWTKYLGLDPEFSAGNSVYMQGVDVGLIPTTRSYSVGIKFNL